MPDVVQIFLRDRLSRLLVLLLLTALAEAGQGRTGEAAGALVLGVAGLEQDALGHGGTARAGGDEVCEVAAVLLAVTPEGDRERIQF